MTDWNAFSTAANSVLKAYSDSALKRCLIYLEPQVLDQLTLKDRLFMMTNATSSKWARDSIYAKLFKAILTRHPNIFENAPLEASSAYNALINYLFTEQTARSLAITSAVQPVTPSSIEPLSSNASLSFEKRQSELIQKGQAFQDLLGKAQSATTPQQLLELEKEFDDRNSKRTLLKSKRQKLTFLIQNLPKEPPAYLQPLQYPQKWQELFEAIHAFQENQVDIDTSFADIAAFQKWVVEEEAILQNTLKAVSVVATAKTIEPQVADFKKQLKDAPRFLFDAHVGAIGGLIEEKILSGMQENEIKAMLLSQKEKLVEIIQFHKQQADSVKLESRPYIQKLFSGELLAFTDLPNQVNTILSEPFEGKAINEPELTEGVVAQYKDQAQIFCKGSADKMAALLDTANQRSQSHDEIARYSKVFFTLTEPAKYFKDLRGDYSKLEKSINDLPVPKQEISKDEFGENQKKYNESESRFLELKANMPKAMNTLIQEAERSEMRLADNKSAIKRRLFEIFWNISPYLDLMESFYDMRKLLTEQLKEAVRKFYAGQLTSDEVLAICQEMPYEHDVVKLRNEITHRSARLKDLRDELVRLLAEVLETRRFLDIAGLSTQGIYNDITLHQKTIQSILAEVENPFKAFAQAETKDDINYVFRKFWIRIEEVQPMVEQAQNAALLLLKNDAQAMSRAFLMALDTVEESVSITSGTRPQLVTKAERDLGFSKPDDLYSSVLSHMHALEKTYGYTVPFSFFMHVLDHKTRLSMLQEASTLDLRIQETIDFAKAMQYVKTFEEERVDIILEAFERQHIIVEEGNSLDANKVAWDIYRERMHTAARLVEDEIFLDIGLLDRRALMDVDQKNLEKTLRLAIAKASAQIFEAKYGIFASLPKTSTQNGSAKYPLSTNTVELLKESLKAWSEVKLSDNMSIDLLLEHLRNYCHNLFDAKILLGSNAKMLLPKCLNFLNELKSFVRSLENTLQNIRGQHKLEWGEPWIVECYSMRCDIELFESGQETAEAFVPLLKKIESTYTAIPEYEQLHQIPEYKKELEMHLNEINELAKDPKKDHPFIYIPGYLAFFDGKSHD